MKRSANRILVLGTLFGALACGSGGDEGAAQRSNEPVGSNSDSDEPAIPGRAPPPPGTPPNTSPTPTPAPTPTPPATPDPNPPAQNDPDPDDPRAPPSAPPGQEIWPPAAYQDLPRGWKWVRLNPMFLSALNVSREPVSTAFVNQYFDAFQATAVHLWADGLPDLVDEWHAADHPNFRYVSWVEPDGTPHFFSSNDSAVLGGHTPQPGRIGYQIGDEPTELSQIQEMKVGLDAVRAADPDALVYVNFHKRSPKEVTDFYGTMDGDIVSYDAYDPDARSYYDYLARFRAVGIEQGRPFWRYSKAYYELGEDDPTLMESDLRWGALVGLTYGYTGHTWFLYQADSDHDLGVALFNQPGNYSSTITAQFIFAALINAEMKNYGRAITQLTSTDVRYLQMHNVPFVKPEGVSDWRAGSGDEPYLRAIESSESAPLDLAIGYFEDFYREKYVIVQNLRHSGAPFPINLDDDATVTLEFDFAEAPSNFDRGRILWFDGKSGEVVNVPLSGSGDRRSVTRTLTAGDIFFYKYATGRGFMLQPKQ
ncbi:MAG: hypothetical protein AAF658_04840 [Myxococcota bacterium]